MLNKLMSLLRYRYHKIRYKRYAAKYRAKGKELLERARGLGLESYSQYAEDGVLHYLLFKELGLKQVSYLDLGCFEPITFSNTYLLYTLGMRGVCVDANPQMAALHQKARPKDLFVNLGVSVAEDDIELDFYVMNSKTINTFDKKEADIYITKHGYKLEDTIKVKIKSINTIIDEYCRSMPELLSIDVEGLDAKVLRSLDYGKHRPKVIIAETGSYNRIEYEEVNKLVAFMRQQDYEVVCEIGCNTIFMDAGV